MIRKPLPSTSILLAATLLSIAPAFAGGKAASMAAEFAARPPAGLPLVDRTRILRGLTYAAGLPGVPAETRTAWLDYVKANFPAAVRDLAPSKDDDALEAAANLIEVAGRVPAAGLDDRLADWRRWALDPRTIGPDTDTGRLGLALVLLHARPDAPALTFAQTLIEAMIDGARYENEMHRFGSGAGGPSLAHRLASRVVLAPVKTVHDRKLRWMLLTNYKYITRKAPAPGDYAFEDALLEHGALHHGRLYGARLLDETPSAAARPEYFCVAARFESESAKAAEWLARAEAGPRPRVAMSAEDWKRMIARNRGPAYAAEMKATTAAAEAALALDVPVHYEPAPNLDERGRTNDLMQGVGRKMGPLRAAYLATGDPKWGRAYKDVVMAQVRQFEDYGDFRCYYNLNVPGPWDGLNAVITYTQAYDALAGGDLLAEEEKDRIVLMMREIGAELGWSVADSNFSVHNMWGRWIGSLGFLAACWPDIPESAEWRSLAEGRLPFLYSGIDKDGGWWEKTVAYHVFTFDLVEDWFAAALRLLGVDLFSRELNGRRLDMMLDWLVRITPPGGELPLFNDSEKMNLKSGGAALRMARVLRRGDFFKAVDLRDLRAAPSEPDIPKAALRAPDVGSLLMEESGYGIFRTGWERDDVYAAVKFGEHGGGHGHFDKASLYLHAFGRPWLIDPGYGLRQTAKHNTVVVDGRDQAATTGRLLAWHAGGAFEMIAVSHDGYPDVVHRRAVAHVKPGTFLVADVFDPLDGRRHAYDWMLQFNADDGSQDGPTGSWVSRADGSGIKVTFPAGGEGERRLEAARNVNELPSNYVKMGNESLYLEIWRGRWTKTADGRAVFAALIQPFRGKEPRPTLTQTLNGDALRLEVRDGGKTRLLEWRLDGDTFRFTGPDKRVVEVK